MMPPDAPRVVLIPRIPCPRPTAREVWRLSRPVRHLSSEKKRPRARGVERGTGPSTTARRAGCWDTDAAGWRIYLGFRTTANSAGRDGHMEGASATRYTPIPSGSDSLR